MYPKLIYISKAKRGSGDRQLLACSEWSLDPALYVFVYLCYLCPPLECGPDIIFVYNTQNTAKMIGCHLHDEVTKDSDFYFAGTLSTAISACMLWWRKLPCWRGPQPVGPLSPTA